MIYVGLRSSKFRFTSASCASSLSIKNNMLFKSRSGPSIKLHQSAPSLNSGKTESKLVSFPVPGYFSVSLSLSLSLQTALQRYIALGTAGRCLLWARTSEAMAKLWSVPSSVAAPHTEMEQGEAKEAGSSPLSQKVYQQFDKYKHWSDKATKLPSLPLSFSSQLLRDSLKGSACLVVAKHRRFALQSKRFQKLHRTPKQVITNMWFVRQRKTSKICRLNLVSIMSSKCILNWSRSKLFHEQNIYQKYTSSFGMNS